MEYFFNLIDTYGLYIIFFIICLEYACFPIPSEIVLPVAGAIGYINNINIFIMILFSSLAGLLGSLFCYYIGYFSKIKIINKLTKKKDLEINESKSFYQRYANISILFGRLIPICRTYISIIAGINKHKLNNYILFTSIGIIIWNTVLISLGYYFYDNIDIIGPFYQKYKIIILSLLAFIIILLITKKLIKKHIYK